MSTEAPLPEHLSLGIVSNYLHTPISPRNQGRLFALTAALSLWVATASWAQGLESLEEGQRLKICVERTTDGCSSWFEGVLSHIDTANPALQPAEDGTVSVAGDLLAPHARSATSRDLWYIFTASFGLPKRS